MKVWVCVGVLVYWSIGVVRNRTNTPIDHYTDTPMTNGDTRDVME